MNAIRETWGTDADTDDSYDRFKALEE